MDRKKIILGWTGVVITVLFSSFWAYWGAFENFHEGWYSASLWENIFMLIFQYLILAIVFVLLALTSLKWKRIGLLLHIALGIFCVWFFSGATFNTLGLLIVIPFLVLGLVYYFGDPYPKNWAYRLIIFVPLIIVLAISIPQGIKVSQRVNDGNFGIRIVEGNGITLAWAPRGPGWPDKGVSWEEAQDICRYLSEDGMTIMTEAQNIWRLPTADEAVRCMAIHGENAGGTWLAEEERAVYKKRPDKETPLWDVHSKVIYYWTNDAAIKDAQKAYIITYHGGVFPKSKTNRQNYQSFRAVKEIK